MKHFIKSIAITIMVISLTIPKSFGQEALNIKVSNIKINSGKIIVEIYNAKTNGLKTPFRKVVLSTNQEIQTASFQVPYGNYAVTIYQEVN